VKYLSVSHGEDRLAKKKKKKKLSVLLGELIHFTFIPEGYFFWI